MSQNDSNREKRVRGGKQRLSLLPLLMLMILSGLAGMFDPVEVKAAIQVGVEVNPNPALANELLEVRLTVTNTGGSASGNVTLNFPYPMGLSSLAESAAFLADCSLGSTCEPGETALFTVGTLAAGRSKTFAFFPRILGTATPGTVIPFAVDALENAVVAASATRSITVAASRVLNLEVAESHDPVVAGDLLTFTLDFGVSVSSSGSPNALLSFPLPTGTTFQSATHGGILNGNQVNWSLGSLNPGGSGQRSVTVMVNSGVGVGSMLTTEAVFSDSAVPANESKALSSTRVEAPSLLGLNISATPNPAVVNEIIDLELTITNFDSVNRSNVIVVLEYPAALASLSESLFDGDCSLGSTCEGGELAIFSAGTLAPGEGMTFSLPPQVAASVPDGAIIRLNASASDATGDFVETSTNIRVNSTRDRDLRISVDRDPVLPGENFTYRLSYGMLNGSTGSPNATLSLDLPEGTAFVSASDGGSLNGNAIEWTLGPLNPGQGGLRTVVLAASGSLVSGSTISAQALFTDTVNPSNETRATKNTQVQSERPLELAITTNADPARPGQLLDVEIVVTNRDTLARSNVVLTMEYPSNLQSLSEAHMEGDCSIGSTCEGGELAIFTLGTLAPGKGRSFSLPIRLATGATDGRLIDFQTEVTDSTGVQIRDNMVVRVDSTARLQLALEDNRDPAEPSEIFEYSVAYGVLNPGGSAPNAQLQLILPPELIFVSASGGGSEVSGKVTWSLGGLNPGDGGREVVRVQVGAGVSLGTVMEAHASFSNGGTPNSVLESHQATRVENASPLELEVVANPNPAKPGEILDVEISVANQGGLNRSGVTLRVEFVDGLASLSESFIDGGDCSIGSTCEAQERVIFDIGTLAAGTGKTFSFPVQVLGSDPNGTVLAFRADLTDSTGDFIRSADMVVVNSSRRLQLGLSESHDPVVPGDTFVYTLTLAALGPGLGASNLSLSLHLPDGVVFSSASDGGSSNGSTVNWALGAMNAGEGAVRTANVQLIGTTPVGLLARAKAELIDHGALQGPTHVASVVRVQNANPLNLSVSATPNPANPGDTLNVGLTVENTGGLSRSGVVLVLEVPAGLNSFSDTGLSGDCIGSSCEVPEQLIFDIGTLGAGQQVAFLVPPVIATNTPSGSVINFDAYVSDSTGAKRDSSAEVLVGRFQPTLTINKNGSGTGAILSSPVGISCGTDCKKMYASGTNVMLTPSPSPGSFFSGWSGGGCSGTGPCTVVVTSDVVVTATFQRIPPQVPLTVMLAGTGSGTVTSIPAGINCGGDCTQSYPGGNAVTLTATPAAGSVFNGWSGGGCSGTGPCVVSMTTARVVTATFDLLSTQNPSTLHDVNGDGRADVVWRNTNNGATHVWQMTANGTRGPVTFPGGLPTNWVIQAVADVNGDGRADVVWRNTNNGATHVWQMAANGTRGPVTFPGGLPLHWQIQAVADVNGDGRADVVWRNTTNGATHIWQMTASGIRGAVTFPGGLPLHWQIQAVADVNGDGRADVVWRNTNNGATHVWQMTAGALRGPVTFPGGLPTNWVIQDVADVNGDGRADVVWRNVNNGATHVWQMTAGALRGPVTFPGGLPTNWQIENVADVNGDGRADVVWRNTNNGATHVWQMTAGALRGPVKFPGGLPLNWEVQ